MGRSVDLAEAFLFPVESGLKGVDAAAEDLDFPWRTGGELAVFLDDVSDASGGGEDMVIFLWHGSAAVCKEAWV